MYSCRFRLTHPSRAGFESNLVEPAQKVSGIEKLLAGLALAASFPQGSIRIDRPRGSPLKKPHTRTCIEARTGNYGGAARSDF
jgi:hypothetical protein